MDNKLSLSTQCMSGTTSGAQCNRKTTSPDGMCPQHQNAPLPLKPVRSNQYLKMPPPKVADTNINDIRGAASTMGIEIEVAGATTPPEIDSAVAALVAKKVGALIVTPTPLVGSNRAQITTLAARHALPAI